MSYHLAPKVSSDVSVSAILTSPKKPFCSSVLFMSLKKMTDGELELVYEIFCKSFRTYFLKFYSHTSDDLRFFPMHHVAKTDKVVRQAQSHLKAMCHLNTESCDCVSDSYTQLIQRYAFELGDFTDDA